MANELGFSYLTGQTIKALVWGKNRTTRWNGTAMVAPSTIADVDWATGMVSMTEQATSNSTGTGQYVGSLPSTGIVGEHQVDYLLGAAPTPGQERIGYQAADTQDIGGLQTHGDSTWATATTVGLSDIDGIDWEVALASILAHSIGVSEVTDSVVEYKRRDGMTTVATVTMGNTAGTRTISVLVGE